MDYHWDFTWVWRNLDVLLKGLGVTLALTLLSILCGLALAILVTSFRKSRFSLFSGLGRVYIEVFRDLPVLVVLVWLFFCLPIVLGDRIRLGSFWVAVLGLGLNFSALEAEILRTGYDAIPRGELDAARSLNFSSWQIARFIIIPQAFWRSLAPTLGQATNTLKLSALASFIAVPEVFYMTSSMIQQTFRPLEFYTALALMYFLTILPLSITVQVLERRLERRFIDGSDSP